MHILTANFISGMSLGIVFYTGDDLESGDKFAMTLDLFIVRITYVISE